MNTLHGWKQRTLLAGALLAPAVLSSVPAARAQNTAPAAAAAPATAVVEGERVALRTRWTAGEQLPYAMSLSGTINLLSSPNSATPLAGIPLDIEVRGEGLAMLNTLSVSDMGAGMVEVKVDNIKLRAESFGQKGELTLQNGRTAFTLNGQRMGGTPANDNTPPARYALEISDRGRVQKVIALTPDGLPSPGSRSAPTTSSTAGASPLDMAQLVQSVVLRAIPALWPTTPVKFGESWDAEVAVPLPASGVDAAATGGDNAAMPAFTNESLGRFTFTARGREKIQNRNTVRVSVNGNLSIDEKKVARLKAGTEAITKADAAPKAEAAPKADDKARARPFRTELTRAVQKVEGDLWVDAEKGTIVRADLSLDTQTAARDVAVPGVPVPARAKPADSFFDFAGTIKFELKSPEARPAS